MKYFIQLVIAVCIIQTPNLNAQQDEKSIKVLIIDGQNTHEDWPKNTYVLKQYLEETGLFDVAVARTYFTWKGEKYLETYTIKGMEPTIAVKEPTTDPNFIPDFSQFDVVVANYGWKTAPWPLKTKKAFETFVKNGGGLVVFHAANNAFPDWKAYNEMTGLGGWGERTEKDGPYVFFDKNGKEIRDNSPGPGGAHGEQYEYIIEVQNQNHPITKGLPKKWLHTKDELYNSLRGPANNMTVLATAYDQPEKGGSGKNEPVLFTVAYGKGKVFHSVLGHASYSIACIGFKTTFLRGTEWAATGKVAQKIPENFPSENETSSLNLEE
jgi:type 1 glutamine amidotransferase